MQQLNFTAGDDGALHSRAMIRSLYLSGNPCYPVVACQRISEHSAKAGQGNHQRSPATEVTPRSACLRAFASRASTSTAERESTKF